MTVLIHHAGIALDRDAVEAAEQAASEEFARARSHITDPFSEDEAIRDAILIGLAAYQRAAGQAVAARIVVIAEPLPDPARAPIDRADFEQELEPTGRVLHHGETA